MLSLRARHPWSIVTIDTLYDEVLASPDGTKFAVMGIQGGIFPSIWRYGIRRRKDDYLSENLYAFYGSSPEEAQAKVEKGDGVLTWRGRVGIDKLILGWNTDA